jgi:hypothetical protein
MRRACREGKHDEEGTPDEKSQQEGRNLIIMH